jgi:hypothetical protein
MAPPHLKLPHVFKPLLVVRIGVGLAAVALAGFALLGPAGAHTNAPGNNGTIKIHQSPGEAEPIVRNEPHVSCLFHIHAFFADSAQTGDWWIKSWPPTGDGRLSPKAAT